MVSSFTSTGWGTAQFSLPAKDDGAGGTVDWDKGPVTYAIIKSAPSWSSNAGQKVLVTLDTQCRIIAQVYDPNNQTWGEPEWINSDLIETDKATFNYGTYRFFDVAYSSETPVIFYANRTNALATNNLGYKTWTGSDWDNTINAPGNGDPGQVVWVKAVTNPVVSKSTEVAVVTMDNAYDVQAIIYNGFGFVQTSTRMFTADTINSANYTSWDIAYEQNSGQLRVWYAVNGNTILQGASYDAPNWNTNSGDGSDALAAIREVKAYPRPNSNDIAVLLKTNGNNLSGALWNDNTFNASWTNSLNGGTTLSTLQFPNGGFDGAWTTGLSSFTAVYLRTASVNAFRARTISSATWTAEMATALPNLDATLTSYDTVVAVATAAAGCNTIQAMLTGRDSFSQATAGYRGTSRMIGISVDVAAQSYGSVTDFDRNITFDGYQPYAFLNNELYYHRYTARPNLRQLDTGGAWTPETNLTSSTSTIRFTQIASSPKRDEKIVATLDSNGILNAFVLRSGILFSSKTIATNLLNAGPNDFIWTPSFDVAYENTSGKAMIAYPNPGNVRFDYRLWDPTNATWGAAGTAPFTTQSGRPWWIKLRTNPKTNSNEILAVTLDSAADIYGYVWDAANATFNTYSAQNISANAEHATGTNVPRYETYDVAYEQGTGRGMVVWDEDANDTFRYCFWVSTAATPTWDCPGTPPTAGYSGRDTTQNGAALPRAFKLKADPNSNQLALAVAVSTANMYVNIWSGSAWGTAAGSGESQGLIAGIEDVNSYKGSFDLAWEGIGGSEVVLAVARAGTANLQFAYTSTGTWTVPAGLIGTFGDAEYVRAYGDPYSDRIAFIADNEKGRLQSVIWQGSALASGNSNPFGSSTPWGRQIDLQTQFGPWAFSWTRDYTAPTTVVQLPQPGTYYFSLPTITGTLSDPTPNNSGASAESVRLQRQSDFKYWNGLDWQASSVFVSTTLTSSTQWAFNVPLSSWTHGVAYKLNYYASDYEQNFEAWVSTINFVYDVNQPTVTLVTPTNMQFFKTPPVITGTANDSDADVKMVEISIQKNGASTKWFDGGDFIAGFNPSGNHTNWLVTSTSNAGSYTTFSYDMQAIYNLGKLTDATYYAQVVVKDNANDGAGNYQYGISTQSVSFVYDGTPPTSGVIQPQNGAKINNPASISGTAADPAPIAANRAVFVAILKNNGSSTWWNQNQAIPGWSSSVPPIWNLVTSTVGILSASATSWIYSPGTLGSQMSSGLDYVILSSAVDQAGNAQSSLTVGVSSITIRVDKSGPISTITLPADSGAAGQGRYTPGNIGYDNSGSGGANTRFVGAVSDTGGAGVKTNYIRLSYLNGSTTQYWNGTDFSELYSTNGWQNTSNTLWRYDTDVPAAAFVAVLNGSGHRQFTLESRAEDNTTNWDGTGSGNFQTTYATTTFIIDNSPPVLGISTPTVTQMTTLSLISGTADATLADLNYVEIKISTNGTGQLYYWTGSSWTTTVTWLSTTKDSSAAWHYTVPSTLIGDSSYTVAARALDYAGQYSTVYSTRIFTIDTSSPTVTITAPADGATYSQVQTSTPMAGTVIDPGAFATGASTASISLVDLDGGGNNYFNGSSFTTGGPYYVPVTGAGLNPWSFNLSTLTFINDHHYTVNASGRDAIGNTTVSPTSTFFYDTEIPTSTIRAPSPGYVSSLTQITGTAIDERFGVRNYEAKLGTYTVGVAVYDVQANKWFDNTNDFNSANPTYFQVSNDTTTSPNVWSYTVPGTIISKLVDGKSYRIVSRAVDLAGNAEFASSTAPVGVGITIIYDPNPPTTTITNPYDSTPSADTTPRISTVTAWGSLPSTIIGEAADGSGAGNGVNLVQLRIWKSDPSMYWQNGSDYSASAYSIDPTAASTAWFNAQTTNSWVNWYSTFTYLSDYKYHIEVRARDLSGQFSTAYATSSFIMDQNVPQSGILVPADQSYMKSLAEITGTMAETGSRYQGTVSPVKIAIRQLGPPSAGTNKWWDNGNKTFTLNNPPTTDNATLYVSSWSFNGITSGDLTSGTSYYITSKAMDDSSPVNDEGFGNVRSSTFTWDIVVPTATIFVPNAGGFPPSSVLGASPVFYGGYWDTHTGIATNPLCANRNDTTSGTSRIEYLLSNRSENPVIYWRPDYDVGQNLLLTGSWVSTEPTDWPDACVFGSSWTITSPDLSGYAGENFGLVVRAQDRAGNVQTVFTVGVASNSFTVDTQVPDVRVTAPVETYRNTLAAISATASDNLATVTSVDVRISSKSAGVCPGDASCRFWDGSYWVSSSSWMAVSFVSGNDWAYTVPGGIGFIDGLSYTVEVRGTDSSGNQGNIAGASDKSKTFKWDVTPPSTSLDKINGGAAGTLVNDQAYNSMTSFGGSASDTSPGLVQSVDMYIKEGGGSGSGSGVYWNGVSFSPVASAVWPFHFVTTNFSTATSAIPWVNGQTYWLRAKALDYADNEEGGIGVGGTIVKVHYDTEKPVSKITNVTNNSYVRSLSTLSGTASDIGTGANPGSTSNVYLHLYRNAPSNLTWNWDTAAWDSDDDESNIADPASSVYWSTTSYTAGAGVGIASGTWTRALPSFTGLSGNTFRLLVRAKDWAGNVEINPSTATFTLDQYQVGPPERPKAIVSYPTSGMHTPTKLTTISGTGQDNTGGQLASVGVLLRRFNSNGTTDYWGGFAWGAEPGVWPTAVAVDGSFNSSSEEFTFAMPGPAEWTDDIQYEIRARAIDAAGNQSQIELSTTVFTYDPTAPDTAITFPVNSGYISQTGNISGTASDTGAGQANLVQVRVRRYSDNKFLDISGGLPGSWVVDSSSNTWNDTVPSGSGPWTWTLSTAAWVTGETYEANARARDRALNYDLSFSTVTFAADFLAPTSVVTGPSNGSSISSLTSLTGTAIDNGPSGVSRVYVAVYGVSQNAWWNKTTTGTFNLADAGGLPVDAPSALSNYWVLATTSAGGPINWLATGSSTPTFPITGDYQVLSVAVDIASNIESLPTSAAPNSNRISFSWVPPVPQSVIQKPDGSNPHYKSSLVTISGTANSPTATGEEIRIKDITNAGSHLVWNGLIWVSSSSTSGWVAASFGSAPTWSYSVPSSSWTTIHRYQIEARATGVPTESPVQGPISFYVDDGNPTATIVMPDVAYKNSLPIISGSASDDGDSLPSANKTVYFRIKRTLPSTQYWVSVSSSFVNDTSINCISAVDNSCLPATNLGGGIYSVTHSSFVSGAIFDPGASYTVYEVVKDRAGNGYSTSFDFTWDVLAATAGITRPTASQPINSLTTISGTAADDFSVYATSISLQSLKNNQCYDPNTNFFTQACPYWIATSSDVSANWQYVDSNINVRLGESNTFYVLLARANDVAGNPQVNFVAGVSSRTFLADTVAPQVAVTFPVHNSIYKGSLISGGGFPFVGTATDPGSPFNAGIRKVQNRLSYLLNGDTWYWQPGQTAFSSGTAVASSGWFNTSNNAWAYFGAVTWGGTDRQYILEARAEDASYFPDGTATGNTSVPATLGTDIINFIVDDTPPSEAITVPSPTNVPGLTLISGTANATLSGLSRVEVKISTGVGTLYYWTSSSWTTVETWLNSAADSQTAWHYTVSGSMVNDATYTVVARALDNAGNYATTYSTKSFTVDLTTPTASITFPTSNSTFARYSQIVVSTPVAGTASDSGSYSTQLSTVQISIHDNTSNNDFNGATFAGGGPYFLGANGGSLAAWTFNSGLLSLTNDHQYQVTARTSDNAGNYSDSTTVTFEYDIEIPTSAITSPATGIRSNVSTVNGTASDERFGARSYEAKMGTYTVGVAILSVSDGKWWDESQVDFQATNPIYYEAVNSTTVAPNTWSYAVPAPLIGMLIDGNVYRFVSRSVDLAGNVEFGASTAPAGIGVNVTYDATPPSVSIGSPVDATPADDTQPRLSSLGTISGATNDGTGTGANLVQVRIYKSDPARYWSFGSDYSASAFTINTSAADTAWFSAATSDGYATWSTTFSFLSDYKYHIEVRARDNAGNYSTAYATATFIFDQDVPQSGIVTPADSSTVRTFSGIVGTMAETGTRYNGTVSPVKIAIKNLQIGKWWNSASSTFSISSPVPTTDDATLYVSSWVYTDINSTNLNSGSSYYITSRAFDNASPTNDENYFSVRSATFTFDNTAPSIVVQTPNDNSYFTDSSALTISGTAADSTSGVALVQVRIKSGSNYWTGTENVAGGNFTAVQATVTASYSNPTWQFRIVQADLSAFTHAQSYTIEARASDVAGSTSSFTAVRTITYDIGVPTAVVTAPLNYINATQTTITGTAQDSPAGIALVEIAISSSASGAAGTWYDGSGFTANFLDSGTLRSTSSYTANGAGAGIDVWGFTRPAFQQGKTYLVRLRITDRAGNVRTQTIGESAALVYDAVDPTAAILDPDAAYERSLGRITGTAVDADTAIALIDIAISTGSSAPYTDQYWNGSAWQPGIYWLSASPTDGSFNTSSEGWYFTGSTPTWINNRIYKIQVKPKDSSLNNNTIVNSTFTFDNTPALAAVVVPASLAASQSLTLVSGTMSDAPNPSPTIVQIALRHPADTFWDGAAFNAYNANTSWLNATSIFGSSWTFTNLPTSWNDRTLYKLFVRAIDAAGNPVADPDFANTGLEFLIDYSSPTSSVTSLSVAVTNYVRGPFNTVTGSADDDAGGSGIGTVKIRVIRSDGNYLNASQNGFDTNGTSIDFPLTTTNGTSWSKTFMSPAATFQDGYRYQIQSRATDNSNPALVQQIYTTATVIVDMSTPTAAISNLSTGFFNSSFTVLLGTMTDVLTGGNIPSGVRYVNVKIFDGTDGSTWWDGGGWNSQTSLSATVYPSSWSLSGLPTDWSHATNLDERWFQFYVQAVDYAGNTQSFAVLTATYDVRPGTAAIVVPNSGVVSSLPSISGTATDTTFGRSGIASVEIAIQRNNGTDTNWYRFSTAQWEPASIIWSTVSYNAGTGVWTRSTTNGNLWDNLVTYDLYVRAIDNAGNVQSTLLYPSTYSFVFQPPPSVIAFTKPTNNKFYRENLQDISGTNNAATNRVDVQIERLSDGKFWSGYTLAWVGSSTYTVANALTATNWSWNSGIPTSGDWFVSGATYTIRARGVNTAGISGAQVSLTIGFDNQAPTSVLTNPLTAFTSSFALISGTASDQLGMAGINNIKLDIQRVNKDDTTAADGYYWNGSTWTNVRPSLQITPVLVSPNLWNWSYTIAYSTHLANGYKYKIYLIAEDESFVDLNSFDGNDEAEHSSNVVYDITMPTATITSVMATEFRSSVVLASGAVSDPLGALQDNALPGYNQVNQVQVSLRRNSNSSYWNGTSFPGTTLVYSTASLFVSSWVFTSMPDFSLSNYNTENFTLRTKTDDKAGNVNALFVPGTSEITFTVDNHAPTSALTLPTSNAKRSQLTALSGTVDDNTASDFPNNAGVSGVSNVDALVYNVQGNTTYYWNGTIFSSNTTEAASWQSVDVLTSLGTSSATWTYNALDSLKMTPGVQAGWISDRAYVVKVRARDNAFPIGNVGSENVATSVIIDTTSPTSAVTYPNTTPVRLLATISGTCSADLAGFGNIKFSMQDHNGNYFNGSGFSSAGEVFLDTRTLTNQSGTQVYTSTFVTSANLTSGSTYTIRIYGTDAALPTANTQVGGTPGSFTFYFDNTPPETLSISAPINNGAYGPSNTLSNITGGAIDNHSGVVRVELEIFNQTDALYFGGSSFNQVSSSWVNVGGSLSSWSFASPAWIANKNYQVRARAFDSAGNVSTTSAVAFIYDSTNPVVSSILVPSQAYQAANTLNVLSGTAHDGLINPRSGLQNIEVAIHDIDDGDSDKWYSGVNASGFNQSNASWRLTSSTISVASATAPWSYPFGADEIPTWQDGHQYDLYVRATDLAQNVSTIFVSTFIYDPVNPAGYITKPDGAVTPHYESSLSTISGTAADTIDTVKAGAISTVDIRIRHIGGSIWWNPAKAGGANWDNALTDNTAWFATSSTDSWAHWQYNTAVPSWTPGQSYAISMRVRDQAGNYSSITYSTFTFDTNLPSSRVTLPLNGATVNSLGLTGVSGTAADSGSPVTQVRVAIKNLNNGLWYDSLDDLFEISSVGPNFLTGVTGTSNWNYATTALGDGDLLSGTSYYATSEATDSAGNVQADFSTGGSTFTFDNTSPLTGVTRPPAAGVIFSNEAYYRSLSTVSGTADDFTMLPAGRNLNAGIGSANVKVSIKDLNTTSYWKQSNTDFSESDEGNSWVSATFVGTSSGTWSYSGTNFNAALTNGHTYVVKSSATDLISNVQTSVSSNVFVFDSSAPMAGIVVPSAVSLNSLTQITGTARDYPFAGALKRVGMDHVEIQIIDLGDDQAIGGAGGNADTYWDTSSFAAPSATVTVNISGQGLVTWTYDNPDSIWQEGHTYRVHVTPFDGVANSAATPASAQFVFDSSAPTTTSIRPAEGIGYNGTSNQLINLSATAIDMPVAPKASVGVNTSKVYFTLRRDDNNNNASDGGDQYWDGLYPGTFDQSGEVVMRMHSDGGVNFSTAAPTWDSGYRYFLETWTEDALGNVEQRHTRRFTVDIIPPDSAITFPSDNSSFQNLTSVAGTAADVTSGIAAVNLKIWDLGSDFSANTADDLYWSEFNGWVTASTQVVSNLTSVYVTSATWSVTPAGNKLPSGWTSGRIYKLISYATDTADNVQGVVSTITFRVDNTAPVAGITLPAHNSGFNSLSTLSGTAGGTEVSGGRDFSQIAAVNLQIIDISTSPVQYWNGGLFTTAVSTKSAAFVGYSSGTWTYNNGSLDSQFISGHNYRVLAWAQDSANNTQTSFTVGVSSNVFYYDNVASTSAITVPADQGAYRTFTSFSGTAGDDFSGVNAVSLTISYVLAGSTYYWDGVAFDSNTYSTVGSSVVHMNQASVNWSYNTSTLLSNLVPGRQYTVFSRSVDRSSNFEVAGATATFLYDTYFGTATFTNPTGNGVFRSPANPLLTVQGTSVDFPSHRLAGIARNEIRIRRTPPGNEYWDGSGWALNSSTWMVTVGSTSWSFAEPSAHWQDNTDYTMNVRTIDLASNLSLSATQTFTFDSGLPIAVIQDPDAIFEKSLGTILGTAGDYSTAKMSGLYTAKVAIERNPTGGGNWWDGSGFNVLNGDFDDSGDTPSLGWIVVSTTSDGGAWTLTGSSLPVWSNDQAYLVKIRAQDNAQNFSSPISSYTFTYDNVAPVTVIQKPVGAPSVPRTSGLPIISGTSSDTTNSNINYVQLRIRRNDLQQFYDPATSRTSPNFSIAEPGNSAWFTADTSNGYVNWSATFTWTTGISYAVQARTVDKAGNISNVVYSTFTYDTDAPQSFVSVPSSSVIRGLVTVSGTASDGGTVVNVEVAVQNLATGLWFDGAGFTGGSVLWQAKSSLLGSAPFTWTYTVLNDSHLTTGTSYYIITRSSDDAGNLETDYVSGSETFTYDINVPTAIVQVPANNAYYRAGQITTLSGTAADTTSTVRELALYIQRADGQFWTDTESPADGSGVWGTTMTAIVVSTASMPSWSYTLANESQIWAHNQPYRAWIAATDLPGNVQTSFVVGTSSNAFTYDTAYGTSVVVVPVANDYYNASTKPLPVISGTAIDETLGSRVQSVSYSIKESGSGLYWNANVSTFSSAGELFNAMAFTGPNVWTSTHPTLQDGLAYQVRMRATDKAGNVEPLRATTAFTFDVSSPTTRITRPVAGSEVSSLPYISGTVSDNTGTAGVQTVELAVAVDTGGWYNDSNNTFDQTSEYFFTAVTTNAFSTWFSSNIPFQDGHVYGIKARATDKATNVQTIFTSNVSTLTFTFDNVAPVTYIQKPVGAPSVPRTSSLPIISGTASDTLNSSINYVQLRIRRNDLQQFYDPATSRTSPNFSIAEPGNSAWFTADTSNGYVNWSATFTWTTGISYAVQARTVDKAGNISNVVYSTFTYDTDAPQSFVSVPSSSVIRGLVTVSGTASDGGTVVNVEVAVQNLATDCGLMERAHGRIGVVASEVVAVGIRAVHVDIHGAERFASDDRHGYHIISVHRMAGILKPIT